MAFFENIKQVTQRSHLKDSLRRSYRSSEDKTPSMRRISEVDEVAMNDSMHKNGSHKYNVNKANSMVLILTV